MQTNEAVTCSSYHTHINSTPNPHHRHKNSSTLIKENELVSGEVLTSVKTPKLYVMTMTDESRTLLKFINVAQDNKSRKQTHNPDMVAHTCNSIGQEAKGTQEASLGYTDPVSKTYKMDGPITRW